MLHGGDGVLGLDSSFFLQTRRVEFIPKGSILVSSDHMTFSHASSGSSRWSLANFRRAWTCAGVIDPVLPCSPGLLPDLSQNHPDPTRRDPVWSPSPRMIDSRLVFPPVSNNCPDSRSLLTKLPYRPLARPSLVQVYSPSLVSLDSCLVLAMVERNAFVVLVYVMPTTSRPSQQCPSNAAARTDPEIEVMAEDIQQKLEKYRTAPFDARFPNQNQTKNCWQNYLDYHRCQKALEAKGVDVAPCDWYKRVYKSICPMSWVRDTRSPPHVLLSMEKAFLEPCKRVLDA
ncbi:hypothetical protein NFI96_032690, partial [Prochilodus magdalenae]